MSTPEIERLVARAQRSRSPRRIETANGIGFAHTRPYLELQLSPSVLSPADSRAIKKAGGSYSECRGFRDKRFVRIPWTREGLALVDGLLQRYPLIHSSTKRSNIVFRSFPRVGTHVVQAVSLAQAQAAFVAFARCMHRENRLPRPLTAAERHALHVQRLLDRRAACLRGLDEINAELAKLGIEVQS